jgi:hypothetical protein
MDSPFSLLDRALQPRNGGITLPVEEKSYELKPYDANSDSFPTSKDEVEHEFPCYVSGLPCRLQRQ